MTNFEPLVGDLFIAWQKTREAIGRVETSQPAQLSSAMEELVIARREMENVIRALMVYASSH